MIVPWRCSRLEGRALLLADELNSQQALAVALTLEEIQCRNSQLINKYVLFFLM